jgi:hypothetical protein
VKNHNIQVHLTLDIFSMILTRFKLAQSYVGARCVRTYMGLSWNASRNEKQGVNHRIFKFGLIFAGVHHSEQSSDLSGISRGSDYRTFFNSLDYNCLYGRNSVYVAFCDLPYRMQLYTLFMHSLV